jgi:hypothetical protein
MMCDASISTISTISRSSSAAPHRRVHSREPPPPRPELRGDRLRDDEEGEDDERAEGQGRGRMLGMKGVCTPCVEAERGGPSLSALSIQRARSAISAISIQRASKKVERSDHGGLTRGERARLARCALHAVELQRRSGAPRGACPWARGASRLASHKGTVARSDPKKSPVLCMEHVCEVLAPEARARTRRAARALSTVYLVVCVAKCEHATTRLVKITTCASSFQHSSPTRRLPLSFLNQRGASRWVRRRRSTTCRSASTSPCGTSATRSTTFRTRGPSTRPEARRRAMA